MSVDSRTPQKTLTRPSARRLAAVVAALAVGAGLTGAPSTASAEDSTASAASSGSWNSMGSRMPALPGGNVALTWAPLYMADQHEYTRAQAERLAKRFDLVSSMPYGLSMHSAAMRRLNPDLTLLAYSNATLGDPSLVRGLPEAAFAHTAGGARIKASHWNTYLMQPDHAQWRATADKLCRDRSELGGFDGCLVDMLTLGIYAKGEMTGLPAQPGTRRTWSQAEYRQHMVALAADLRRRSPNLVQVGNMVENSYRYWESDVTSRPLVTSSPSAQMEDFLRGAHDAPNDYPTVAEWRKNVQVVTDMEATNKVGLFTTKVWSGASKAAAAQWQAYSMASFLMGANGKSFFAFTRSRDKAGASQTNARYTMPKNLGLPRGGMRSLSSGAFSREFANGVAVVNPTSKAVRVPVPGTVRRLNGSTVAASMTLPPRSGDVMVRSTPMPFRVDIGKAVKKMPTVRPGRWSRLQVRLGNNGGKLSPRGKVRASGRLVKTRSMRVPALKAGRTHRMRVPVKLTSRKGKRALVKLVYTAGGKRDVVKVPVRVLPRRR